MWDEIIDAEAKSNDKAKLNNEESKTIPKNFNLKDLACAI